MIERDSSDPLAEWILTDVADKTQRGTSERIREKMTRLSHEVAKNKQEAERRVLEAERRMQEAERGREEAERSREEAQIGREEAERRLAQMSLEERGGEGERHWLLQRGEIHMTNQKLGKRRLGKSQSGRIQRRTSGCQSPLQRPPVSILS